MINSEYLEISKSNLIIFDSFIKANSVINNPKYKTIVCSISGGADSDIVLDLCTKIDIYKKIKYVWLNTGLEYGATKKHLEFLEQKYSVVILKEKAKMPIPTSNKKFGEPFLSKQVSEWISRLQRYNFQWEDEPLEMLLVKYPKCKAALRWWCNDWTDENKDPSKSRFNIAYNKYLKEFMIKNPPTFSIANKCCQGAKKDVVKDVLKKYSADLNIFGVRKAEGGARASAYKNCFSDKTDVPQYRPIFWYSDDDRKEYESLFNITHSACYSEYGLIRTGCAGCPFGKDFEFELDVINKFEPKLYKGVNNIFKESYNYTRQYKKFCKERKEHAKLL